MQICSLFCSRVLPKETSFIILSKSKTWLKADFGIWVANTKAHYYINLYYACCIFADSMYANHIACDTLMSSSIVLPVYLLTYTYFLLLLSINYFLFNSSKYLQNKGYLFFFTPWHVLQIFLFPSVTIYIMFSFILSVQFSCSVMFNSLWCHGL